MTVYMEPVEVAEIIERSGLGVAATELAEALRAQAPLLVAADEVPSNELLHTYTVRLKRWQAGGGPECIGLENFVKVLDAGHKTVLLFGAEAARWHLVGLLDPSSRNLLAATAVARLPRRPDDLTG